MHQLCQLFIQIELCISTVNNTSSDLLSKWYTPLIVYYYNHFYGSKNTIVYNKFILQFDLFQKLVFTRGIGNELQRTLTVVVWSKTGINLNKNL